jgi:DNA-binding LacI/PurR family transcriptional regulator
MEVAMTTMKDIADAVGVSLATVSNAWNRPHKVSEPVRRRIFEAASRLGYSGPHPLARGLRMGRTGAVGVLLNEPLRYAFADPAAVTLLRSLTAHEAFDSTVVTLLPAPPPADDGEPRDVAAIEANVHNALVDAFVLYSTADDDTATLAALRRGEPVVIVDQPDPARLLHDGALTTVDHITFLPVDDRGGARAAGAHLATLGHRRVGAVVDRLRTDGYAGFVDDARRRDATFHVQRERLAGWTGGLGEGGGSITALYECNGDDPDRGGGALAELRSAAPHITAVLAMTDLLAIGVMRAARAAGLRVPDDLSVVGFDDLPAARRTRPALTTVRQPLELKGTAAARALLARLGGHPQGSIAPHPTELIVRASTGPVAAA